MDRNKPILQTEKLCKTYGSHAALSDLDLTVHEGEVFGYIGPNGAGKTTTFRMLCGLLSPTSGKATIDGGGVRVPIWLGLNYYTVEGVVARNGAVAVARIEGDNNVLRRVSAYNASTDENSAVIFIWGDNNLLEDVVAAGTGRYMVEVYEGAGNTLRRVFTRWGGWDGRDFCGVSWPAGYNVGVYNASNTTVENVIAYGRVPGAGIMVQANYDTAVADNNHVLGSMALLSGRDYDGSAWTFGTGLAQPVTRPGPTGCGDTHVTQWGWGGQRVGFLLFGQGALRNNVFRDVLASDNMGVGFSAMQPYSVGAKTGNVLERAALLRNGAGAVPGWETAQGGQIYNGLGVAVTPGRPVLDRRYVGRVLTSDPLWPWPMEGRAQAEMGISITALAGRYVAEGAR